MTTQLREYQEIGVSNDFGQLYSDQIYNCTLDAKSDTTLTVPGGGLMGNISSYANSSTANKVMAVIRISVGGNVWFANNGTAGVPAGNTFAKATSEVLTDGLLYGRMVKVADVLHFYTTDASTSVSVAFYAMPS
jgi:hypothetical protein